MNIETANRLLSYRKKHNLSQEELSEKIGVSRQAISKWERAEASPDTDNLILLARLYNVTLDELLTGGTDDKKDESDAEDEQQGGGENTAAEGDDSQPNNPNDESDDNSAPCEDKVSFKNGIHVHSKNGDKVDLSFTDGIHVQDKNGEKVSIDKNGIFVSDNNGDQKVYTEDGHIYVDDDVKKHKARCNPWFKFPYPIFVSIAFLVWGFCGGWAISWILFLTVPLYYSLIEAIIKKKPAAFAFPVLVVGVYLWIGIVMGLWHPWWIIFLSIPIYYCLCDVFKYIKK